MTVAYNDVVFAFSMEEIYSVGATRFLRDRGPNQFDFQFPGGANDPTVRLDGGLYFNAGPQYIELPAAQLTRFYAAMSTGAMTFISVATVEVGAGVLFSCWNNGGGGINKGITLLAQVNATVSPRFYQMQGGAATPYMMGTVASGLYRKRSVIYTMETTPRGLTDQAANTPTWTVGAFGVTSYDTAIAPRFGSYSGGGGPFQGSQYYACAIRGAISSPDMASLSAQLANSSKPFCVRR